MQIRSYTSAGILEKRTENVDKLGWKLETTDGKSPHVKNVVATRSFNRGDLISVERPMLTQVGAQFSMAACHGCLVPFTPKEQEEAMKEMKEKEGENDGKEENDAKGHNAAVPVYCKACKEKVDTKTEDALKPLREAMGGIAKEHQVDVILLSIIANLELARAGVKRVGVPYDSSDDDDVELRQSRTFQSTVQDWDAIATVWDRKPEAWRKKVGPALRALHKELVALAGSGKVPGYASVSPLPRLQCDAPLIDITLQAAYHSRFGPLSLPDVTYAFGFYPGMLMLAQGCAPNAHLVSNGSELEVRAIMPISKGDAITVSHVPLMMPREQRQSMLEQQRFVTCGCARCKEPMKSSLDRLMEGVVCLDCQQDVLLPCDLGEENDAACAEYKKRLLAEREMMVKGLQKKLRNAKTAEAKEKLEESIAQYEAASEVPEGVHFWTCQHCGGVEPAHTIDASGPADVMAKAKNDFHQACIHKMLSEQQLSRKDAEGKDLSEKQLMEKVAGLKNHGKVAKEMLERLAKCMDGRLPPYHYFVMEALPLILQMTQKEQDWVKVLQYGITKWDMERSLVEDRPTKSQLTMLNEIRVAAQIEQENAKSATIRKQFGKKAMQAEEQIDLTTESMYGKKLADKVKEARKIRRKEAKEAAAREAASGQGVVPGGAVPVQAAA